MFCAQEGVTLGGAVQVLICLLVVVDNSPSISPSRLRTVGCHKRLVYRPEWPVQPVDCEQNEGR